MYGRMHESYLRYERDASVVAVMIFLQYRQEGAGMILIIYDDSG
jgi:hypothetical protein